MRSFELICYALVRRVCQRFGRKPDGRVLLRPARRGDPRGSTRTICAFPLETRRIATHERKGFEKKFRTARYCGCWMPSDLRWQPPVNDQDTAGEFAGAEPLRESMIASWRQSGHK